MTTSSIQPPEPSLADRAFTFQVTVPDLGPLIQDEFALNANRISPIFHTLKSYQSQSVQPSAPESFSELAADDTVRQACRIIAQPSLQIGMRVGGPQMPSVNWAAYIAPEVSPSAVVVVIPVPEATLQFKLFQGISDFIGWFSSCFASSSATNVPNYLPPPITLESTIYVLHAIDCFQRQALKKSLAYGEGSDPLPPISAIEFQESLERALTSRSHRWLLSTFLSCAPDLDLVGFEPKPENLASLATHDFLRPTADGSSLAFGEAGVFTGAEFCGSWPLAVGIRIGTLSSAGGERTAYRAFLAPTLITNHLFKLEFAPDNSCTVNHQTKTSNSLEAELHLAMANALETRNKVPTEEAVTPRFQPSPPVRRETAVTTAAAPAPAEPATPRPTVRKRQVSQPDQADPGAASTAPAPATRFCYKCGTELDNPDAAFCRKCGAKIG